MEENHRNQSLGGLVIESIQARFAKGVLEQYRSNKIWSTKSVRESSLHGSSLTSAGHPEFDGLDIGERAACNLAVTFFDMSHFTARSFWEPLETVTRLAQAVLTQFALIVEESGGFVLGLRGDGLMAGWGGQGSEPEVDVVMCMAACAIALDSGKGVLNDLLARDAIEPVQIRAGVDWGEVNFIRTGTNKQSDMNIVGFAANFAAKCEKYANAWEIVVGEGASLHLDETYLTSHADSPKDYQYKGERRIYSFNQFAWKRIVDDAASAINQIGGRPTSAIVPTY